MQVLQLGFHLDPARRGPAELLAAWPSLVDIAESAASAGVRVAVAQTCATAQRIERNGVTYHFLEMERAGESIATSKNLLRLLDDTAADVVHVHGFGFPGDVIALSRLRSCPPILLQHHADAVPRWWRRAASRRGFFAAAGLAFTGREQSERFAEAGLIAAGTRIFDIPESTSRFTVGDQAPARERTGLAGDPCLLWVGHLNRNKDPLAVLAGVALAAERFPQLKLWCCFATAPLLADVQRAIAQDVRLRGRVELLGVRPHDQIEHLMQAADVFVSGSHREGSGYSLIEALACGLPAVVTDIPPFRALLGDGAAGALWRGGDPHSLCAALTGLLARPRPALRAAARARFDAEVSSVAVGRKWAAAYGELAAEKLRAQS